jgi:hypothetical protein
VVSLWKFAKKRWDALPNINSLTTFSGILAFAATMALLYRRGLLGSILLIIAGSGGLAIAWDRWSYESGHQVHFTALFSAKGPSSDEAAMILTHGPLLLIGLLILFFESRRSNAEKTVVNTSPNKFELESQPGLQSDSSPDMARSGDEANH